MATSNFKIRYIYGNKAINKFRSIYNICNKPELIKSQSTQK